MVERRKNKRTELITNVILKRLDGGENEEVGIEVTDVSKTGVGFTCKDPLTIGAIYESYLTIWTNEVLHAFLEIIRVEKKGDTFSYGATFVGMPEMDACRIETYQTINENER